MLEIKIKEDEIYQAHLNKFVTIPSCTITLEHSLISLAKWESKWHVPYLSKVPKTVEQEKDYIRSMVIGNIPNPYIFDVLSVNNILEIRDYMDNPMTATTFTKTSKSNTKKEIITAEVIYSRMFANNISIECQKWHLNRLFALIHACDLTNNPRQKMSKRETAIWNAEQNAARRARYNTRG